MGTAASVIPAGRVGRSSPSRGWGSGNRMTFGQGAHRVRLLRCFDTRTAGRHPLTTGTDGALLRWIVSRASEGYSKHARCAYCIPAIEGHHLFFHHPHTPTVSPAKNSLVYFISRV